MSKLLRGFWILAIFGPIGLILLQYASISFASQAHSPTNAELRVAATDFKFTPSSSTANSAVPAKVTLANSGSVDHTWVLLDKDGKEFVKIEAKVGQTASKDFVAPPPGSYSIICDVPGHKESGMIGTLTVR